MPNPHAEIVVTGSEILLGKLVDTNSSVIAGRLQLIGIPLQHITAVGDDEARMAEVLRIALARSALVITTGGLGPTVDDVTREAVAAATGRALVFSEALFEEVSGYFTRLGRKMSENNRRQAFIPDGALPLSNPVGTAPSFIVETEQGALISMPGVPREMIHQLDENVLPYLRRRFGGGQLIVNRTLYTAGMGESALDSRLGDAILRCPNPTVGLNARPGQVVVRLTATAADESSAQALIAGLESQVRAKLGDAIYGAESDTLESVTLALLAARGLTLATAEAGTRGQLAGHLASAPGAGATYAGGRVAPHTAALAAQLGVTVKGAPEDQGRALAQALCATPGAGAGLVLLVEDDGRRIVMAHARAGAADARTLGYGAAADFAGDWGASFALDWLRRGLRGDSKSPAGAAG
jgi:nicotinamide-nucleotide amidase